MKNLPISEVVRSATHLSASRLRRQHELAVRFGLWALKAPHLDAVLNEACGVVSRGMGSRFAKVLKYLPDQREFLLETGVGWDQADIGVATLGADDASPAGFAFANGGPVISNHLGQEHRFRTPEILTRYGIERAINVPIRGTPVSYGVLEADSTEGDEFIESDIVFLEGVANVISMTLERIMADSVSNHRESFSASVLDASPDCIEVIAKDGAIEFMNLNGLKQMQVADLALIEGKPWTTLWPESAHAEVTAAIEQAFAGGSARFEAFRTTMRGEPRWWDVSISPIVDEVREIERVVTVARDISERREHEERLSRLVAKREIQIDSTEMMMKEVHHRVRNSLQLVQTLLFLQANLAAEEEVKSQLKVAANRVMTVASVHERLYKSDGVEATDAALYLEGLIDDLRAAFDDRAIELSAASMILPARRLAPLGLIACELVTNALKYGKGKVSVGLERSADVIMLTVCDEGNGFPESFPMPQGTGLGMRLVRTYAGFGNDSIAIDRSVSFSKIVVKFKVD
jgi:PAS domain S-box-containing protein